MTVLGGTGVDATGRSTGRRRTNRHTKIVGQFAARPIEMLESPAYRVLSLTAHRVLARIEVELAHHGGTDNGKLPVTFADFESYGIHRHAIAPAIRELEMLGFIEVTEHGRAGNAEFRTPNRFRITYRHAQNIDSDGSHEWRKVETMEQALALANAARRTPKKQNPSAGKRQVSVSETDTENENPQCRKPSLQGKVQKPPLLSISPGDSPNAGLRSAPPGTQASKQARTAQRRNRKAEKDRARGGSTCAPVRGGCHRKREADRHANEPREKSRRSAGGLRCDGE